MNTASSRPWVIAGALVAVVMFAVTWFVVVSPTRSDASTLREDTLSVQTQNDVLAARNAALERQAEDRPGIEAAARAALASLPDAIALPDLNRELALHAQARDVVIKSISVGAAQAPPGSAPVDPTAPATGAGILSVPITLETTGGRADQMFFLRDLQEVGPRAALVTSASVTAEGEGDADTPIPTTMTTQFSVFSHALTPQDRTALAGVVDGIDSTPGAG